MNCPHFRWLEWKDSTVYIDSGGWNRDVPLFTEMSSLQGIEIKEFH